MKNSEVPLWERYILSIKDTVRAVLPLAVDTQKKKWYNKTRNDLACCERRVII